MAGSEQQAGWFILGTALVVLLGFLAYALMLEQRAGPRKSAHGLSAGGAVLTRAGLAAALVVVAGFLVFLGQLDPNGVSHVVPAPEGIVLLLSILALAALAGGVWRAERRVRAAEVDAQASEPAREELQATARLERGPRVASTSSGADPAPRS
ncbi:MAG: hypothetical protein HY320_03305 [Armatimonadetes bacterium]|nr:hypothetical protein [Armatimonadota bacterium]